MKASIIIPTLNRAALLERALSSICRQSVSSEQFETLVIDNGSTDSTRKIANAFVQNHSAIKYIYEPQPGLLAGRHRGAIAAVGELLVFVDDDIEAVPGWLAAIIRGFKDSSVQLIGGRSLPNYEVDPPAWIESFWETAQGGGKYCWYLSLIDLGQRRRQISPTYIFGLNLAIRRNAFFDLGGFHPDRYSRYSDKTYDLQRFSGDGEAGLTMPAEARGRLAIYEPEATVYHFVPASRMTPEYYEKRAYFEGISDSYRRMRPQIARPRPVEIRHLAGKVIERAKRVLTSRMSRPLEDALTSYR